MKGFLISSFFIFLIINGPVRSEEDSTPQPVDDSGAQNKQGQGEEDEGLFISTDDLRSPVQINEEPPRFTDFNRNTEVEENSIQFNPQINVEAVDPEGSMVTYEIVSGDTSNAFTIHPTLGTIQLTHPLAYQSTPLGSGRFNLTISATDSGVPKRTSTTQVSVIIIDKNDNRPVFLRNQYTANITELTTPGIGIRTVMATDNDARINKEIIYELQGSNQFTINPRSGVISIAQNAVLDIDENGKTYHLTALAKDQGSPQLTGSAMVTIYVSDSNNHPPVFTQNTYWATVSEGSSIGTVVAMVRADDSDSNANINYQVLSVDHSDYQFAFAMNRLTGELTTQRILQRENVDEIKLVIRAEDINAEQPRTQTATATIRVLLQTVDQDDVEFSPPWTKVSPVINIEIPEDTPVGTSVFTLRATDATDSQTIQSFSKVPESDTGNYFSVQQSTGIVTLNRALDFDSMMQEKQVQFQIVARRTSSFPNKSAVATMVFKVTDVNDNSPRFLQQSYTFRTSENARFPSEIGTITAVDGDSGVFGQVYYTLSGDGSVKFYLDRISGKLVVASNQTLDADVRRVYDMIVTASDSKDGNGRSATASVRIELDDVNDNPPQFSRITYTTYNNEEMIPSGVSLEQVSATDKDVTYGTVTYSIYSGNAMGLFTIDPTTGTIRASRDLTPYKRSDPYILSVKALDNSVSPLSVETRVEIYLLQTTNTTSLSFIVPTRDRYVQTITEGLPDGTAVTTITARDNNGDASGKIIYRLASETSTFNLNRTTGILTTRMVLDREEREEYELTLVAQSQDKPEREVSRILIIKVNDVNDNRPRYTACLDVQYGDPHEVNVAELKESETVIDAKACDFDSPPNNIIRYSIICGNRPREITEGNRPFKIDSVTGRLTSEVSMDAQYTFQICIKASDGAGSIVPEEVDFFAESVRRNPSILRVTINVGGGVDFNNFPPNFHSNNATYTTSILSNTPFHSEVIQIIASTASRAQFAYSLLNVRFSRDAPYGEDIFIIDRDDGTIYTNRQHFREFLKGNFTMQVDITRDGSVHARAGVVVYVIPETGILRLTFSSPIERFTQQQRIFENEVSAALKAQMVSTGVRYSLTGNKVASDKFDYCFHLRDGNSVYTYERANKLFKINELRMKEIYASLQIGEPELGTCMDVNATTSFWSDRWYLWWIIIAIGIFLGVFILITIIWICICFYWSRNKVKTARPFLMLDTLNLSRDQLEWQEQTVKMS